jgi:hypothetical protein
MVSRTVTPRHEKLRLVAVRFDEVLAQRRLGTREVAGEEEASVGIAFDGLFDAPLRPSK